VAAAMTPGARARADAYVAERIPKFDGVTPAPEAIKIAPKVAPASRRPEGTRLASRGGGDAANPAGGDAGATLIEAIDTAIERIEAFHRPQLPRSYRWGSVAHPVRPLRRLGCYVP